MREVAAARKARRDAALAPIGAAIVLALTNLARQLAAGTISHVQFVVQSQAELAAAYGQAASAGAQQAASDFGLPTGDSDTATLAASQAARTGGWLAGLATMIAAADNAALSADTTLPGDVAAADSLAGRIGMYANSATGAWQQAYVGAITDMTDQATFTWIASGDSDVCDWCDAMDGTELSADDLGGALFPGDADFGAGTDGCDGGPNCRCWLDVQDVVVSEPALAATGGPSMTITDPAVTAAATDDPPMQFHAYLVGEGVRTIDGRQMAPGALTLGELPLPWMYKPVNTWGHDEAVVAGTIDTAVLQDNGMWYATGTYSDTDIGRSAAASAADQSCRFVSIDVYAVESTLVVVSTVGPYDCIDEGEVEDVYELVTAGEIRGATQLPFPALPVCVVAPADVALPEPDLAAMEVAIVVASGAPVTPPDAWFSDPQFAPNDGRMVQDTRGNWGCPLTVTDDGHVFGHIAAWKAQHIGWAEKMNPPRSPSNYAYFRTGNVKTAEGNEVAVGQLTMGCGHFDDDYGSAHRAKAHYDGGAGAVQVCDVAAGEDDFGIWVAGAVRPEVTDEQLREFRALAPSGDWRQIAGHLELVACVQVPVPGFPVPRAVAASGDAAGWPVGPRAGMRDGELVSLVAAGRVVADPLGSRFAHMEAEIGELRVLVASLNRERLAARI